ncbi:MAG: phosphoglucomutase (alpha-D-glucose-1,6-bisphosphate-dependent) [Myxococcales bacterium]|nr:phosphoglucomutase (alpha-D-glucose-1,6-bisphosphate-dependent) [Myxococcales bacterium]
MPMSIDPRAGQPAAAADLVDIDALREAYFDRTPDPSLPAEAVSFGTSGHRGSSLDGSFNEAHVLATTQAVCDYRRANNLDGPVFVGRDTHALSDLAEATALRVLAANRVDAFIAASGGATPTPVVSFAILEHNRGAGLATPADGLVITPSHNPPEYGGFKYNPPHGGPADTRCTQWIEARANELLRGGLAEVSRIARDKGYAAATTHRRDFVSPYVDALGEVLDMDAIAQAGLRIGVDPMGGAGIDYWAPIAQRYGLRDLEVVNERVDPAFGFMHLDQDGRVRMDCSSRYAMAGLVALQDRFDIAFGNDPDADRHGIVTPTAGLMGPNDYLAVALDYLLSRRTGWSPGGLVGKTLVSSAILDRVAARHGRAVAEVPAGFKWFVPGLHDGSYLFAGEESAGASFLRKNGSVWTTDKDGILLNLLAAEITATLGVDPALRYRTLTEELGAPYYERTQGPATAPERAALRQLSAKDVTLTELAGEPVARVFTDAPGNDAPIGGVKVTAANGWFAVRPSGTEDLYKIYAESFRGPEHLAQIQATARALVERTMAAAAR